MILRIKQILKIINLGDLSAQPPHKNNIMKKSKYKQYERIGDAILFLIDNCSNTLKKQIKNDLNNYIFQSKKKKDPNPHPNSIKAKGELNPPKNHLEAILILMNSLYNSNTANNSRKYIINKL